MSEENQTVENQAVETCNTQKKCCLFHKILGLKGLSNIYKILSIVVIVVMIVNLVIGWIDIIQYKNETGEFHLWSSLYSSFLVIVTYLFYALILFTIARVLKVLRKIKHAVNNK